MQILRLGHSNISKFTKLINCLNSPLNYNIILLFNSFPKENTDNRTKWLLAIGRQSVPKAPTLCSAHFPASSIHDGNGYTHKKRLKDGTVPTLNLQTLDFNHVIDGDSTLGRFVFPNILLRF